MIFPPDRMRSLSRTELDMIRATIYPVVEIEMDGRAPFVLDTQQEKIVAEPVRQEALAETAKTRKAEQVRSQESLFEGVQFAVAKKDEDELPEDGERISKNVSIRLVRGIAGSGKTLVLMQRAKFLAAQYPDWKISVLSFNKPLQVQFQSAFKGTAIKPHTFHSLCWQFLDIPEGTEADFDEWLSDNRAEFGAIRQLGKDFVKNEIDWLRDLGVTEREKYLALERRGVGQVGRLVAEKREMIFDVLEDYRSYLQENRRWDYHELPLMLLQKLESGEVNTEKFDSILIDEAQDWAPIWFKVINHFLAPDHGLLFLADDPSQSIFRHFSWKEKAVNIVGRTRWLRVPYRNTFEIYSAAYSMIAGYDEIQTSLSEEGELVSPDISSQEMRHGKRPLIERCGSVSDELTFIRSTVDSLKQEGYREDQIAVLSRYRTDLQQIGNTLRGTDAKKHQMHSFKGLEMEAIIIPHLQKTFSMPDDEAAERRLLYMAMSRSRARLIMTYSGRLPKVYEGLRNQNLADFVD
jgi:superfamily I DNA/RNA helicase